MSNKKLPPMSDAQIKILLKELQRIAFCTDCREGNPGVCDTCYQSNGGEGTYLVGNVELMKRRLREVFPPNSGN